MTRTRVTDAHVAEFRAALAGGQETYRQLRDRLETASPEDANVLASMVVGAFVEVATGPTDLLETTDETIAAALDDFLRTDTRYGVQALDEPMSLTAALVAARHFDDDELDAFVARVRASAETMLTPPPTAAVSDEDVQLLRYYLRQGRPPGAFDLDPVEFVRSRSLSGLTWLTYAVFVELVRRRFASRPRSDVIRYVDAAVIRHRQANPGDDLDPAACEAVIRRALGEASAAVGLTEIDKVAQLPLMRDLVEQAGLDDAALEELLGTSRAEADRWLRTRRAADHRSAEYGA